MGTASEGMGVAKGEKIKCSSIFDLVMVVEDLVKQGYQVAINWETLTITVKEVK